MISLYYSTDDPFSLYGIQHFIEKNGISVEINQPSLSGIVITYGVEVKGDFLIKIENNEIKDHICGKISVADEKIPLCEIPRDTGSGLENITYFETSNKLYSCQTRHDQGITIGIDIFKEIGYLLSGHLDKIRPYVDGKTNEELASKPMVDLLEDLLLKAILDGCNKLNIPLVQKSYWPDGKTFAVCLTHDVDELTKTYQWISRPIRYLVNKDIKGFRGQVKSLLQKIRGIEPYDTFEDIIAIESGLKAKSTYFILKESGHAKLISKKTWYLYGRNRSLQSQQMQTLIQRLTANGDEVAIHGSYFSYKDPDLLKDETHELEQLINAKVIGSRQHNLNLEIPATWHYQEKAGLMYDTTLGFKDTIGFRWGTSFPFFPNTAEGPLLLLEIPLIIMDICLEPVENKKYTCFLLADKVEQSHGVLTLLWHPPLFNTFEYSDFRDLYININQYCQKKEAWITRSRDIYNWVIGRNELTFSCFSYFTSCTIIPFATDSELFFTIRLPQGKKGSVQSENADIIKIDGNLMYIKTHDLINNNKIIIDIV
jgi:hypothetical protein